MLQPRVHGSERACAHPSVHGLQLVCPSTSWYVPAAHGEHSAAPSAALNEPGAHGDGAVEPVEQLLPAVQAVHSEAATRMVALEKVEAGQGSAAAAHAAAFAERSHIFREPKDLDLVP